MKYQDFDEDKEWQMSEKEHDTVVKLSPKQRYEHFIERCAESEYVWSLKSGDDWVVQKDDEGRQLVPVWPHSSYARDCATGQWKGAIPEAIHIDDWLDVWLPRLKKDRGRVAVFPTSNGQPEIVEPARMGEDLLDELEQFELDE